MSERILLVEDQPDSSSSGPLYYASREIVLWLTA
jgi:hypothetical protein